MQAQLWMWRRLKCQRALPLRSEAGSFGAIRVAAMLVSVVWLTGCGSAPLASNNKKAGTSVIVVGDPRAKPRLSFGSLALLMTQAQLQALKRQGDWLTTGQIPAAGSVTLTPPASDEAQRYQARLEGGKVIQLEVTFRAARTYRASMRHDYARSKIQHDGSWAMTDPLRATLVLLRVGGASLVATHLGATQDKSGVRALLERYLGE